MPKTTLMVLLTAIVLVHVFPLAKAASVHPGAGVHRPWEDDRNFRRILTEAELWNHLLRRGRTTVAPPPPPSPTLPLVRSVHDLHGLPYRPRAASDCRNESLLTLMELGRYESKGEERCNRLDLSVQCQIM